MPLFFFAISGPRRSRSPSGYPYPSIEREKRRRRDRRKEMGPVPQNCRTGRQFCRCGSAGMRRLEPGRSRDLQLVRPVTGCVRPVGVELWGRSSNSSNTPDFPQPERLGACSSPADPNEPSIGSRPPRSKTPANPLELCAHPTRQSPRPCPCGSSWAAAVSLPVGLASA